jgi:hyperosmotically inducible periplasmic protein
MSRHHVMMISQTSATAFLAGASRQGTAAAKRMRVRSNRGAAAAADDFSGQIANKGTGIPSLGGAGHEAHRSGTQPRQLSGAVNIPRHRGGQRARLKEIQMIHAHKRMTLLAAIIAGTALMSAGCSDRNASETAGQKLDRSADKVAAATERATKETAVVVDDAAITTKVKTAVLAEPGLKTLQINVDTKDGVVTLSGTVDTPVLKERAMQIAQQTNGVRSVVDNLAIKSTG